MNEPEVYGFLTDVFREVFMRDDIVLRPELTASDVAGWDSFRQIEIILATQERLGIKLSTKELDRLERVGDLVELIVAKTSAA
jgi:acyl carrier protein